MKNETLFAERVINVESTGKPYSLLQTASGAFITCSNKGQFEVADLVEAPGGSTLLYDARTWHRAGINRTAHKRAAILQAMVPSYVMPKNDTTGPFKELLDSPVYELLDDRVKQEIERLMMRRFSGPPNTNIVAVDEQLSERARQARNTVTN